jgi:DNA polymerase-3 subunit gamma/tau
MSISLAIKYRPNDWSSVVEQSATKKILQQQLDTKTFKNAYLFCGAAGTGKTTCARIFANEINEHQGNPIEMDAASNSSVEDIREIIQQAKTKSLNSEYKVFIIDECHSLSDKAWQALLKLIEEPPAKSIFIFCTTDSQRIPKTILSRVQRYDFKRISHKGIVNRLHEICVREELAPIPDDGYNDALNFIANIADGGMRDSITLMDKCLAYSKDLTLENVIKALGTANYDTMFKLTNALFDKDSKKVIEIIEDIHMSGLDLKQFVKQYMQFILDINKYDCLGTFDHLQIPATKEYEEELKSYSDYEFEACKHLLDTLIKLNSDIKWETSVKPVVEAILLLECCKE